MRPRHIGFLKIDDKSDVGKLLHKIVRNSISAVDAVESRKASSRASRKFTDDGLKADTLTFAAQNQAPILRRGRQDIAQAKRRRLR